MLNGKMNETKCNSHARQLENRFILSMLSAEFERKNVTYNSTEIFYQYLMQSANAFWTDKITLYGANKL